MKTREQIKIVLSKEVLLSAQEGRDGMSVSIRKDSCDYFIIASWGMGWEHVSMSLGNRTPTWEEMCWLKDIFWNDTETVIQYHPAKKDYVNYHKFFLHLWKPLRHTIPTPPTIMIGFKDAT